MKKLLTLIFFIFVLLYCSSSDVFAGDNILKVRGYQYGQTWYPLTHPTGNPPPSSYLTTTLYNSLINSNNFGVNGKVTCIVDVKSDVSTVSKGSLVDNNGDILIDVFWGAAKYTPLTDEEANELAMFVKAGGILYISGNGWLDPSTPGRGSEYNLLFEKLNLTDNFSNDRIFEGDQGSSSLPTNTPITLGPFGSVGQINHGTMTKFNINSMQGVAKGYLDSEYLIMEKQIGKGYLAVSSFLFFVNGRISDLNNLKYYLNLFSLGCRDDWRDNSVVLDVPSFKQGLWKYDDLNPLWEINTYDHGDKQTLWCDTNGNGAKLAECGCAVTSASMAMKYLGVDKLPDGYALNPATLDNYLSENSKKVGNIYTSFGYVGGNINWHSIDNLTALANKTYPNQTKLDQPKRENYSFDTVKDYIDKGIPVIQKVTGKFGIHWVLVKGYDPDTKKLIINDPIQPDKQTGYTYLDDLYTPVISQSVVTYQKTQSDFSSFQVSSTKPFTVTDSSDKELEQIVNSEYSLDEYYGDATSEVETAPSVEGIYMFIAKTPEDQTFYITSNFDVPIIVTTSNKNGDSVTYSFISKPGKNYSFIFQENNSGEKIISPITIDVRPWSQKDWVLSKGKLPVPVTIFGREGIDVKSIDQKSIRFGKFGTENSLKSCSKLLIDINRDGYRDMTCTFDIQKTDIDKLTSKVELTAYTKSNILLQGNDNIVVIR